MKIILVILLLNTLVFCQNVIPMWFKNLPKHYSSILAVGYTGKHVNPRIAKERALYQALYEATARKELYISSVFVEQMSMGNRISKTNSCENINSSIFSDFQNSYSVIDSVITDEGYYILIQIGEETVSGITSNLTDWGNKPEWVDKPPDDDNYIFGVGLADRHRTHFNAWQKSDQDSHVAIANQLFLIAHSNDLELSDNFYSIYLSDIYNFTDIKLSGVQVISRWFDKEREVYYSLAKAPKRSVRIFHK